MNEIRVIETYYIEIDAMMSRADICMDSISDASDRRHFLLHKSPSKNFPSDDAIVSIAMEIIIGFPDSKIVNLQEVPGIETRFISLPESTVA